MEGENTWLPISLWCNHSLTATSSSSFKQHRPQQHGTRPDHLVVTPLTASTTAAWHKKNRTLYLAFGARQAQFLLVLENFWIFGNSIMLISGCEIVAYSFDQEILKFVVSGFVATLCTSTKGQSVRVTEQDWLWMARLRALACTWNVNLSKIFL